MTAKKPTDTSKPYRFDPFAYARPGRNPTDDFGIMDTSAPNTKPRPKARTNLDGVNVPMGINQGDEHIVASRGRPAWSNLEEAYEFARKPVRGARYLDMHIDHAIPRPRPRPRPKRDLKWMRDPTAKPPPRPADPSRLPYTGLAESKETKKKTRCFNWKMCDNAASTLKRFIPCL